MKSKLNGGEMLVDGKRSPKEGEIMKLPHLADTIEKLANEGKKGFYEVRYSDEILSP